jgi:glycosyltransferase involved in cell wall biosynthesis
MSIRPPRVGFVMEQALGHVAYTKNLQTAFPAGGRLSPVWLPVPDATGGPLDRLPGFRSNWTLRGSARAYATLRANGGPRRFDALFFHTQTVGLLAPLAARRTPVIVSLDATPLNFDSVGAYYNHHARPDSRAERIKRALYRRVFNSASALTTWSQWAKDSLRDDYGIDPERVTVVAPGTSLDLFPFGVTPRAADPGRPVRILFVGGDFERKGGPELLACMRAGLAERCELHVVTRQPVPETPGVHVYSNIGPNDPRLLALYRDADIFALPTHADCLAVVLGEAMAAGLPIVTTAVGAQPEAVRDGHSGIIIAPGDVDALGRALRRLADDPELRRAMGQEGRRIGEARFDARKNAERLAGVIEDGIARRRVTDFAPGRSLVGGGVPHPPARCTAGSPLRTPPRGPAREGGDRAGPMP